MNAPEKNSREKRGELVWRAVRYAVCIGVGYLGGCLIGSSIDGPSMLGAALIGAVVLFMVFRQGAKSQSHAAADAISAANARASAAAVAHQTVTVAQGHIINPATGEVLGVASDALGTPHPSILEQGRTVTDFDRAAAEWDRLNRDRR